MAEAIIDLPAACRERFVPLELPALVAWRRAGVLRAGIGEMVAPWRVLRPRAERALALVTVAGEGEASDAGQRHRLRPGTVWLCAPGRRQELRAAGTWRIAWWYFDPARWALPAPARLDPCPGATLLHALMAELCAETRAPAGKPAPRRTDPRPPREDRAWLLASLLLADLRSLVEPAAAPDRVCAAVVAAIHAEPGRTWDAATLAARAGVSAATLRRRLRQALGTSPRALLADERMALARQLLRHSELTQAAIAERVGYADPFAFARAFHRREGRWPSEVRAE